MCIRDRSDSVEIQIAKKEYKLRSATGTYIAALGKGRISNTITMDEEKMTIQTKPEKKSTIPVLYYEDITDVRVTKKITGYYIFYMAVALLCCFAAPYAIVLVPVFAWLGMNRIITISLRSGNQAVLYSSDKKDAEEFVAAVKKAAKLSEN